VRSLKRNPEQSGRSVRVFLDANTIVSGILFKGNEATLLELGRVKAVELVTNLYVLEEVTRVIRRSEFRLNLEEVNGLIKYVHECITVLEDPSSNEIRENVSVLDDGKDVPVMLGFHGSNADFLVTGDKELLEKILNSTTTKKLLEKILP